MNKDQVAGRAKEAKGAVEAAVGKAVGSTKMQVKGTAEKVAGKAQAAYGDAKDKIKSATK